MYNYWYKLCEKKISRKVGNCFVVLLHRVLRVGCTSSLSRQLGTVMDAINLNSTISHCISTKKKKKINKQFWVKTA